MTMEPDWLPRVEELLKAPKYFDSLFSRIKYMNIAKKLLRNLDKYQDGLVELSFTIHKMRGALRERLDRLEKEGV